MTCSALRHFQWREAQKQTLHVCLHRLQHDDSKNVPCLRKEEELNPDCMTVTQTFSQVSLVSSFEGVRHTHAQLRNNANFFCLFVHSKIKGTDTFFLQIRQMPEGSQDLCSSHTKTEEVSTVTQSFCCFQTLFLLRKKKTNFQHFNSGKLGHCGLQASIVENTRLVYGLIGFTINLNE